MASLSRIAGASTFFAVAAAWALAVGATASESCRAPAATALRSGTLQADRVCLSYEALAEQDPRIRSRDCLKDSDCPILREIKRLGGEVSLSYGPVGSPGTELCHVIAGTPHAFLLKEARGWEPEEVCIGDGGSFVDVETLLEAYYATHGS